VSKADGTAVKMEKSSAPQPKAPIEEEKTIQAYGWM